MEEVVKQIIRIENREFDEFKEYLRQENEWLRELLRRQQNGEDISEELLRVRADLRDCGIYDENNEIAEPYRGVFQKRANA